MKKIILIACFGLISLASCKKDRDCKCTVTTTTPSGNTTTVIDKVTTYKDIKKGDAKTRCQDYTDTHVDEGGGTTTVKGECKLN